MLTNTGRVLYFKNATSCVSLGQFSLFNVSEDVSSEHNQLVTSCLVTLYPYTGGSTMQATLSSVGSNELHINTDSRVWELQFESEVVWKDSTGYGPL